VRRGEHRTLKRGGDARLTGFKYLWLRRSADLPPQQRLVLRALQREDFKVGRAWALKERFRTFWEYRYAPGCCQWQRSSVCLNYLRRDAELILFQSIDLPRAELVVHEQADRLLELWLNGAEVRLLGAAAVLLPYASAP